MEATSSLRELLFEDCPYCPPTSLHQTCQECDGRGFFLRDIIADSIGEELPEAVDVVEQVEIERDALLAAGEAVLESSEIEYETGTHEAAEALNAAHDMLRAAIAKAKGE